ncbi:MAG TPA: bifunctional folylpolyglutamate synthase/dihydrofolate synthase [Candidatus Coprenecus pullistercoris]|nr:bifunctional folylpolyglutamate synthase/dihydrofolate synthase [Candidatus Coprenecus pullistercoris]
MPDSGPDIEEKYAQCVQNLYSMAPSFQRVGAGAYHPGLDAMRDFAASLGNPQNGFKSVHIAGTNGKGSVAHMLASALAFRYPGELIGLYTSPHLVDFRERIKTVSTACEHDGKCFETIGKPEVVDFMHRADSFMQERRPSFFEITTAMAFDCFSRRNVRTAVIETGLGGRLDSTNILTPQLSIITSIGLDHKDILGDTIEKIAAEKAGIIKPGVPVVVGDVPDGAFDVIAERAERLGSRLYRAGELCGDCVSADVLSAGADLRADCQVKNIRTVLTALKVMGAGTVHKDSAVYGALAGAAHITGLRGRWERLSLHPEVICDIGHNVEAVSVSMRQLMAEAGGRHIIMVFGMAGDKDVEAVCRLLPDSPEYILTQAAGSRAMPAGRLKETAGKMCATAVPDVRAALDLALSKAGPDDVVFVGGSSYVVAEALAAWDEKCANKKVTISD